MSGKTNTYSYEETNTEQWIVEIMDIYGDRLTKLAYSKSLLVQKINERA